MNLYVFITYSVADVGGGQMYIKSKAEYLKSKGWGYFCIFNYGWKFSNRRFLSI